MDIQSEKLHLIRWVTELTDASIINRLIELKNEHETDWWDVLGEEEKAHIEEGLRQAEAGQGRSLKDINIDFMAKFNLVRTDKVIVRKRKS